MHVLLEDQLVHWAELRAAEKGVSAAQLIADILRGERTRQQQRNPDDESGNQERP